MLRTFLTACVPVLLWVGIGGCSGSKDADLAPLTGRVMYKDRPVANAMLMIQPDKGALAYAETDGEGRFVARTGTNEGVAVGKCTITVESTIGGGGGGAAPPDMSSADAANNPNAGADMQKLMMARRKETGPAPKSLIPVKYANMDSTPLKDIEIPSSGKKDYEIKLTD